MLKDRVQNLDSVICCIFQLYLQDNLFNQNENSKIQDKGKLNKKTIETLLNELFIPDNQNKNEEDIRQYGNYNGITLT